jgi:hypothetical protein
MALDFHQDPSDDIVFELARDFGETTSDQLLQCLDQIEERILSRVSSIVISVLRAKFRSLRASGDTRTVFIQGERFEYFQTDTAMTGGELDRRSLYITLLPSSTYNHKTAVERRRIPIVSTGRFNSVEVVICRSLRACIDTLSERLCDFLQAAYKWFSEYVNAKLNELASVSVANIYAVLRRGFSGNPKCADSVLLMAVDAGSVFYLMDASTTGRLIHRLSLRPTAAYSPVQLLVELAGTAIPYQNVIAVEAFRHLETASINLRGDWFIENRPAYELGEEAAYGTERVTCFPIVASGARMLAAGFPSAMRATALPILRRIRPNLVEAFNRGAVTFSGAWRSAQTVLPDSKFVSCFISYSTRDEEFATRLCSDLQANAVNCWFAPNDMQAGQKLHDQIAGAIGAYDRLLIILSQESMASQWVRTEIAHARRKELNEKRRVFFPIRIVPFEDIQNWDSLETELRDDGIREIKNYFIPDFSAWRDHVKYQSAFRALLRDLKTEEISRPIPFSGPPPE